MKTTSSILLILATLAIAIIPTSFTNSFAQEQRAAANLSGQEEVPPVQTQATGVAEFTLMGMDLVNYTVNASNIQGATAGHIHLGKPGENGPVVITLFKYDTPMDQISETGSFTAADLEGPMAGQPFQELGTAALNGGLYVNIHTETNPNGEIRGQIQVQ
jgi:CHRD domain-containing protein